MAAPTTETQNEDTNKARAAKPRGLARGVSNEELYAILGLPTGVEWSDVKREIRSRRKSGSLDIRQEGAYKRLMRRFKNSRRQSKTRV